MDSNTRTYRLPDGVETSDLDVYLSEWDKLGNSLSEIIGERIIGLDPGFTFRYGYNYVDIPAGIAIRIVEKCNGNRK